MADGPDDLRARRLALTCALSAAGGLVLWLALAWARAGVFEYPLDDVYIHLAMAKGIAGGTYGINPGEPASAASSILYPLLLVPFAGTEAQRMLPMIWNTLGLLALAWSFGRWIAGAGLSRNAAVFAALVTPFALSMPNVAALGMEHTLHAWASLLLIIGLWTFVQTGRISPLLIVAAILCPLLRYEGLALSLLAAGVLILRGRAMAGLVLAVGIVLPLAAFSLFLMSQGLEPLPSSVLAKVAGPRGQIDLMARFVFGLSSPAAGAVVLAYFLFCFSLVGLKPETPDNRRILLRVIWLAATAHLVLGTIGWMNRYEHYVMVMLGAGFVVLMGLAGPRGKTSIAVMMSVLAIWYGHANVTKFAWAPKWIHQHHAEMARLSRSLPGEAVAANDIGWLAWGGGGRVLDLWGLASPEARRARLGGNGSGSPGWAARIVSAQNVRYAMIYDRWIYEGIGSNWQKVAVLDMSDLPWALAGEDVSIYATDPSFEPQLRAAVRRLSADMASGAVLQEIR